MTKPYYKTYGLHISQSVFIRGDKITKTNWLYIMLWKYHLYDFYAIKLIFWNDLWQEVGSMYPQRNNFVVWFNSSSSSRSQQHVFSLKYNLQAPLSILFFTPSFFIHKSNKDKWKNCSNFLNKCWKQRPCETKLFSDVSHDEAIRMVERKATQLCWIFKFQHVMSKCRAVNFMGGLCFV